MKLLVDESLPRDLKRHLSDHQVSTVPERGWAGRSNGELLRLSDLLRLIPRVLETLQSIEPGSLVRVGT